MAGNLDVIEHKRLFHEFIERYDCIRNTNLISSEDLHKIRNYLEIGGNLDQKLKRRIAKNKFFLSSISSSNEYSNVCVRINGSVNSKVRF